MTIEDRVRSSLSRVAEDVQPPVADVDQLRTGALGRRRRTRLAILAAAAVVATAALVAPQLARSTPQPVKPVPESRGAVWYDDAGLHHGGTVVDLAIDTAPVSLVLVQGGVLYCDDHTADIWYQPWHGRPHIIGHSEPSPNVIPVGPASDPQGTTAAWFDSETLIMYDTEHGKELARAHEPESRTPGGFRQNAMGNLIYYVDPDRVVWSNGSRVFSYDRASGATTVVGSSPGDTPALEDVGDGLSASTVDHGNRNLVVRDDAGQVVFSGPTLSGPVEFSPDGRYVAAIDDGAPQGTRYGPTVGDLTTGDTSDPPQSNTTYPYIGWAYGHTLMYLSFEQADGFDDFSGTLVTYDPRTQRAVTLPHRGTVVIPGT